MNEIIEILTPVEQISTGKPGIIVAQHMDKKCYSVIFKDGKIKQVIFEDIISVDKFNKPVVKDMAVRVEAKGQIGNTAQITINGQIIPVLSADIRIRPNELITVECVVYGQDIDVNALQDQTTVNIVQEPKK